MTKDSILGWILIVLVGISLFLSFTIWSRVPGNLPTIGMLQEEKNIDLASVVSPEKILVYLGNSSNTLIKPSSPLYNRTWDIARRLLTLQWSTTSEPTNIGREYFSHKKGLEIFFPAPLPVSFVKQLFNIKTDDAISMTDKTIDSFILVDDGGLVGYLVDNEGLFYSLGKNGDAGALTQLINEISQANPPLYANLPANSNIKVSREVYVPLVTYDLPVYSVKWERISEDRLAPKFFADLSITRRIQERDGSVIFTDGVRGLRIREDNNFEYNFPVPRELRKNLSFYEAFKIAVDFIRTHGGWPEDCYLASYEIKSDTTYVFDFKIRINGFTMVSDVNSLKVTVEGYQVKSYYKNRAISTKQVGLQELISPILVLDTAVSTKNIRVIDDMYPVYVLENESLKPAWVVRTAGAEVVIQNPSE